jgi:tetratricopeptide (TPR) repeat protein
MKNSKKNVSALTKLVFKNSVIFLALLFLTAANKNISARTPGALKNPPFLINTISGTVFSGNRSPVSNIFVELQDDFYRSINRVRTNGSGRYSFSGMRSGRYVIKVIASQLGYEAQTVEVEVVNFGSTDPSGRSITSNDNVQQDIYLRARKSSSNVEQVTGVVFTQEIPESAQLKYEKAISFIEKKNEAEGLKFLQQAVDTFPNYFLALNRLGYEYFKQENFTKASENLAKAADVNPSEPTIYLLSYSLYLGKNYDLAAKVLNSAVKLHNSSRLYTLLGGSLRLTKKVREAEEALKKAQSLDEKYPEAHWQLALLYGNNLNKFGEAAKELEQFLKLQPESKDVEKIKKLIQMFKEKEKEKK